MFYKTVMEFRSAFRLQILLLCLNVPMFQCIIHFSLNNDHLNKRLISYTIVNQTGVVLPQCAQGCMYLQQCVSINYCIDSKTCEMNAVHSVDADSEEFVNDDAWNYVDIVAIWAAKVTRTCENKVCGQNEECLPTIPEAKCIKLPGCAVLPTIENASLKPGGTLENTTRTYTCDSGYAAIDGAPTIVKVCESDETWTNDGEACHVMCSSGSYSQNGVEPCSVCPIESYQPDQGETSCISCPPGTTTLVNGRTAATDCKVLCSPGQYSASTVEPCSSCPLNTYQPNSGQTGCYSCPNDMQTLYTGRTSVEECEAEEISQWVTSVYSFSSEDESDNWSADQIIGPYDTYPVYGDIVTSWGQLYFDANQFIEVVFDVAVFITGIDIYETYNSGGVVNIIARDINGQTHLLWGTTEASLFHYSRIFSPPLQVPNVRCQHVRLNVDCTVAGEWVEIDAVRLTGTIW